MLTWSVTFCGFLVCCLLLFINGFQIWDPFSWARNPNFIEAGGGLLFLPFLLKWAPLPELSQWRVSYALCALFLLPIALVVSGLQITYALSFSRTEIANKIRHFKPTCVSFDPSEIPLKPIHLRQHFLSFYNSLRHHTEDQMTHNLGFRTMRCHHNAQTGIRSGQWAEPQTEASTWEYRPPALRADVQCQRHTFQFRAP